MNNSDVGKFISELRKEKGLTQKELAEKLKVTDKAVSKWETGRSAPDIALLTALSEILGVTVIEILQGEKIETEKLPAVSDEVVVRTMKNDNKRLKRSVLFAIIIIVLLISASALSYPVYHFFNSVPTDNEIAILNQISKKESFGESENMKIIKTVKKGDYFFYLLSDENKVSLRMFEKDELFDNRIKLWGGIECSEPNEIARYCCGKDGVTINAFFGYGMTDTEYSYYYRGVKCTKQIEDEFVLDVLIDINDSFTNASVIYDE